MDPITWVIGPESMAAFFTTGLGTSCNNVRYKKLFMKPLMLERANSWDKRHYSCRGHIIKVLTMLYL